MRTFVALILTVCFLLALTACSMAGETGDDDTDPEAAQSFFPQLGGYNITTTENIQDAIATAMGGAALGSGNVVLAGLIAKINSMIDCYRRVGAVDARIYTQRIDPTNLSIPIAGVLAVINQDRIRDNFLACALQIPGTGFTAQAAEPTPCYGYGTFTFNNDRISFLYAATDQPLCDAMNAYFAPYNPEGQSGPIIIPGTR